MENHDRAFVHMTIAFAFLLLALGAGVTVASHVRKAWPGIVERFEKKPESVAVAPVVPSTSPTFPLNTAPKCYNYPDGHQVCGAPSQEEADKFHVQWHLAHPGVPTETGGEHPGVVGGAQVHGLRAPIPPLAKGIPPSKPTPQTAPEYRYSRGVYLVPKAGTYDVSYHAQCAVGEKGLLPPTFLYTDDHGEQHFIQAAGDTRSNDGKFSSGLQPMSMVRFRSQVGTQCLIYDMSINAHPQF